MTQKVKRTIQKVGHVLDIRFVDDPVIIKTRVHLIDRVGYNPYHVVVAWDGQYWHELNGPLEWKMNIFHLAQDMVGKEMLDYEWQKCTDQGLLFCDPMIEYTLDPTPPDSCPECDDFSFVALMTGVCFECGYVPGVKTI